MVGSLSQHTAVSSRRNLEEKSDDLEVRLTDPLRMTGVALGASPAVVRSDR